MVEDKKCVYCGKIIVKRSKEHIIQNAIGGLYESEDICCPDCNNYVSKYIDAPFTKTFNPIISHINNFTKTNNTKSKPLSTGKAIYDGEVYDVSIKNGRVIACPELSKKLQCDISKLNFKILAYDFPIENISFKNGIAKIAFNFAIEKGICVDLLKKGVNVQEKSGKIDNISFKYSVIPFVALNPMDEYIELNTEIQLYHNLILFNQGNMLWCYVDLFNTFQYYVLLSEEYDGNISVNETYCQLLQKIDRTVPKLYIRKPKDIFTYAIHYNIEPCMDVEIFKKRVAEAIQKESVKKDITDILSMKLGMGYLNTDEMKRMEPDEFSLYLNSLLLYFDENDRLKNSTFRKLTYARDNKGVVSYPLLINTLIRSSEINVSSYTFEKFKRLTSFLSGIDKVEESMNNE